MRIFAKPNYDFIRWRWHALAASLVLTIIGIYVAFFHHGLPLGVEFTGGTVITADFVQPVDEGKIRAAVEPISKDAVVQKIGESGHNRVMIRLPLGKGEELGTNLEADAQKVEAALKSAGLPALNGPLSKEIIGAVIGADLQKKGVWATLTALGGILIYVGFRFRFNFAVGAVVAAIHDILITLSMLAFFKFDMTLNVVAAILTITGYSVNDTIVVFDRVRENQRLMRREPLDKIVNASVNQTLGRTIITSGVTFLAVMALYIFGGDVLRGFAFTMLVGVITGTYSTVFIAASIAIILSRRSNPPAAAQPQAKLKRA
jgi:preprotein translocase subunit SecF